MRNIKSWKVWLMFTCVVVLFGAGCKNIRPSRLSSDSKITLLYSNMDEAIFGPNASLPPASYMFMPFITWDGEKDVGVLLESWESDKRNATYHIHENMLWHDGTPVTSYDVEFAVNLLSHPDVLRIHPDALDFKVIDDFSFAITYHNNTALGNVEYSNYACLPKHLLKDLDPKEYSRWDFWKQPVGNGPYRYVRHVQKTMTELEANPDYFRGEPKIKHVFLKYGGNPLTELLSGEVDYSEVSTMESMRLGNDPRFYVLPEMPRRYSAMFWNHNLPFFKDVNVRKALTLAVNRRELFQLMNFPDEIPVIDAPGRIHSGDDFPAPLPFDPKLAKTLLDNSGWIDLDGDGIREKDGEEFQFTAITTSGQRLMGAVYVQDQLSRIGVRMEIQTVAYAIVGPRLRKGDFEAALWRGNENWLMIMLGGKNGNYPSGYENPDLEQFFMDAQSTLSLEQMRLLEIQLWSILQADIPVTYLQPEMSFSVVNRRVRGFENLAQKSIRQLEHLWIEKEK